MNPTAETVVAAGAAVLASSERAVSICDRKQCHRRLLAAAARYKSAFIRYGAAQNENHFLARTTMLKRHRATERRIVNQRRNSRFPLQCSV